MSLPLKLNFSDYDNFLTEPNYTTSAEAQDYFRNMDMLVEALIDVGLWQPETNYPNGHVVFSPNMPNGTEAVCVATNGGKSSNTEPSWGEVGGDNVSDGTCFWKLRYKHWSKDVASVDDMLNGTSNDKVVTPYLAVLGQTATNRLPNATYKVDDVVYHKSNLSVALKCTTAGTTSADELDISGRAVGESVTDGTCVWNIVKRSNVLDVEDVLPIANGGTDGNTFVKSASISGKDITLNMSDGTNKTLTNTPFMPDYTAGVSVSQGFVAPTDGLIFYAMYNYSQGDRLKIDNISVAYGWGNAGSQIFSTYVFISKGQTVTEIGVNQGSIHPTPIFYPFK